MKRQPAARGCGLSAFCAAVCANESRSCRSTEVLESRLARSKLDSASKKNSAKCLATLPRRTLRSVWPPFQEELGEVFGHLAADRPLEGSHVRSVQRLCVYAVKFRCSASPGRACMSAVDRVDHVQECLLRDPVRRRVGHELARKQWSMRVHSIGLLLINNLCHAGTCTATLCVIEL